MNKLYDRIYWHNNTTPALNETNLNSMSKAIDDIDDRVVEIAGDIMTTIPQLEEDLAEAQELIDDLEDLNEHTPYIGANGNWWVWNVTTKEYEDTGVDASITVRIADITMLAPSATPYVTNTGTSSDPIFHLFIPRGTGVQSVAKTSTSGLTDTYTMTFTDSTTYTYSVVNGKGISSISKTSTSGLVDTYTITYNDNTTTTFTVTNGKSAYQAAQEAGYSGTESEFNTMLASVQTYATSASQSASAAEDSAEDAEAWAVGTRDGSPVPSTDPTYHNNAKYWSDEAQHTTTLDGLSDVTITSPQNNDALVYDSATQSWKNGSGGGGASTLSDLTDTAIATPSAGQALVYSSVGKWTNVTLPSIEDKMNADGSNSAQNVLLSNNLLVGDVYKNINFINCAISKPAGSNQLVTFSRTSNMGSLWEERINGLVGSTDSVYIVLNSENVFLNIVALVDSQTVTAYLVNDITDAINESASTVTFYIRNRTSKTCGIAQGNGCISSGDYAFSSGLGNVAKGNGSSAEGGYNLASGGAAHVEGYQSISSNIASHAEGQYTTASGMCSHAEGQYTTASNDDAHAEGYHSSADGKHSHSEGYYTDADGQSSHAEGKYTQTGSSAEGAHAEGYSVGSSAIISATGIGAHAEGATENTTYGILASGKGAHAEGWIASARSKNTTASGDGSHAEGQITTASNTADHAEGYNTTASGGASHSEGGGTTASGGYSHAEGESTKAAGVSSHAEGNSTKANGNYSHAEGSSNTAGYANQHVQGKYNDNKSTTLFEIGNGTSANRKNIFEIYDDGYMSFDNGVNKIKFGVDANGRYGYIKAGADTVYPFKNEISVSNITPTRTSSNTVLSFTYTDRPAYFAIVAINTIYACWSFISFEWAEIADTWTNKKAVWHVRTTSSSTKSLRDDYSSYISVSEDTNNKTITVTSSSTSYKFNATDYIVQAVAST